MEKHECHRYWRNPPEKNKPEVYIAPKHDYTENLIQFEQLEMTQVFEKDLTYWARVFRKEERR